jgi:MFS family permease
MPSLDASTRRLTAVTACAMAFSAMQGLSYPLLALWMHRENEAEWVIGCNAAMMPLGFILAAAAVPKLVARLDEFLVALLALAGASIALITIGTFYSPAVWTLLRLAMGFCLGCVLILSETWATRMPREDNRGRIVGLFSALLSVGFAFGPGLLVLVGDDGFTPFLLGGCLPWLAFLVLVLTKKDFEVENSENTTENGRSFLSFIKLAPYLMLIVAIVAFADEASMTMLPIYSVTSGYGDNASNIILVVMIFGIVTLQYPVGWLADRMSLRKLTTGIALLACTSIYFAYWYSSQLVYFFISIFFWGGFYYALYVICLIYLSKSFTGADLVAGNSAVSAMWGVGGVLGPSVVGGLMGAIGKFGFIGTQLALFAIVLVISVKARNLVSHPMPNSRYSRR